MDVTVTSGGKVIGRSGGMNGEDGEVDPWSHFVNAFVLDREGNRIDRRNAEDMFIPLYSHQIPPGAADSIHYAFTAPPDVTGPIAIDVRLQYRKFDTTYMRHFKAKDFVRNDLPIVTLATDRVVLPVAGGESGPAQDESKIEEWQRWNDYGIGLLLKGATGPNKGELRQAEAAFAEVERLGRADGPLNLARVYIKEGRLDEAVQALHRAAEHDPPARPWSVAWFSGLVNKQNGYLDEAIADFKSILAMKDSAECRKLEFDFSQDYGLLNELGQTLFERAKRERGDERAAYRREFEREAVDWFDRVLELDPENVTAHYNLAQLYSMLGDDAKAQAHRALHARYKPDDNAMDRAISAARLKYPAANHAAESVVIYDLQREGAYGLELADSNLASRTESGDDASSASVVRGGTP
jgi:tetratricopeptide (TPR) repeat protein